MRRAVRRWRRISSICLSWKSLGAEQRDHVAIELEARIDALEVETVRELAGGLVDRVGQLVLVDFGNDIERGHGEPGSAVSIDCSRFNAPSTSGTRAGDNPTDARCAIFCYAIRRRCWSCWRRLAPPSATGARKRHVHAGDDDFRVVTRGSCARTRLISTGSTRMASPIGSIDALRTWRRGRAARTLLFATNAGIYDRDYRPLGLTIAGGKTLRPLNTTRAAEARGNFGMQPNGVFYVDRRGTCRRRARRRRGAAHAIDARVATQSGPMLVDRRRGESGISSKIRTAANGAAASARRRRAAVVFAVSETPVTFHAFARIFRDTLGCRDALYLDGTLSQIYTAADGYSGAPDVMVKPYAGMLAVFANTPASRLSAAFSGPWRFLGLLLGALFLHRLRGFLLVALFLVQGLSSESPCRIGLRTLTTAFRHGRPVSARQQILDGFVDRQRCATTKADLLLHAPARVRARIAGRG